MRKAYIQIALYVAAAAALLILFAVLVALVQGEGSADVGREGQVAIQAEATLSVTAAAQNGSSQLLLLSEGASSGWVDQAVVNDSIAELEATVDELERRSDILAAKLEPSTSADLANYTSDFVAAARSMTAAIVAGDPDIDVLLAEATGDDAYLNLVNELQDLRDGRVQDVLAAAEGVGRFADAVRFLVIVVIPIMVMVASRRTMRRQRERDELEARLVQQTEINASKDRFVANLSHELRTPLTAIYGFGTALAESGFSDRDEATELTDHIISQTAELNRMVDDLITAGKLEARDIPYEIDDVDLGTEIEYVIERFRRSGANISVEVDVAQARADRIRLRQVLQNLVSNACKHGGDHVEIVCFELGNQVALWVVDDGDGVPEEIEGRLFRRYLHAGDMPLLEGSVGLGLAIARALAEGMGGSLDYKRLDDLTCFELKLPAVESSPARSEAPDLTPV